LRSEGLGQSVVRGAGLQFLGIALRTLITIFSTAVLARLLTPADFGYIAMALVVTEFAALFGAFGFTNVLIQRKVINRLQLDTVFWASLGIGTLLAGLVVAMSLFSGLIFADSQVGPLLRVLAISFVINSLGAVPWVVLSRQLMFRTEFYIQVLPVVIRTVAAVAMAYAGMGVWSLVWGGIVGAVCGILISFARVPFVPRWRFHMAFITSTWRISGGYFGNTALYYISTNLDLLLLGRSLGATSLGYYQNARSLTDEIRARIAMPLQHVLFPAFSAVQTNRDRFQNMVMTAGRLLAAVVVPVGFGVSANATELVLVLYGEQWRPMIPVMAMFGISAALRAATAIGSPLFNANNKVGLALRYNSIGTALLIGGVLLAMPYGIEAVAASVALTSLYSLVSFRAAFGLIGLGMRDVLNVLARPMVAATAMWLLTEAFRQWQLDLPVAGLLAIQVALGAAVYTLTLHLLSRQYWLDFSQAVRLFGKKG